MGHDYIKFVGRKDSNTTIVKTAKSHNKVHDAHGGESRQITQWLKFNPSTLLRTERLVGDEARGSPRQPVKRRRVWSDQMRDASYWLGIDGENYET